MVARRSPGKNHDAILVRVRLAKLTWYGWRFGKSARPFSYWQLAGWIARSEAIHPIPNTPTSSRATAATEANSTRFSRHLQSWPRCGLTGRKPTGIGILRQTLLDSVELGFFTERLVVTHIRQ